MSRDGGRPDSNRQRWHWILTVTSQVSPHSDDQQSRETRPCVVDVMDGRRVTATIEDDNRSELRQRCIFPSELGFTF